MSELNLEKLKSRFSNALGLPLEKITDDLSYNTIPEWDSMGHMAVIAAFESEFNIMFEIDDIIAMNTFGQVREIIKKYGIEN